MMAIVLFLLRRSMTVPYLADDIDVPAYYYHGRLRHHNGLARDSGTSRPLEALAKVAGESLPRHDDDTNTRLIPSREPGYEP